MSRLPAKPDQRRAAAETSELLDQMLSKAGIHRSKFVENELFKREINIERLLPAGMKGHAKRLIQRAVLTFNRRPELAECPEADFIRCVLQAAEIGLAIDGQLCHVVRYKNAWQVVPDYKGLVAVAKRSGVIKDVYADCVAQQDKFRAYRQDDKDHLFHERMPGPRSAVVCAYSVIVRNDGTAHFEVMDISELNAIQARAPFKSGPWATDPNEMRKKTVIKRALKLYTGDAAIAGAIAIDDAIYEQAPTTSFNSYSSSMGSATAQRTAELRERMAGGEQRQDEKTTQTRQDDKGEAVTQDAGGQQGSQNATPKPANQENPPADPFLEWREIIDGATTADELDHVVEELEGVGEAAARDGLKEIAMMIGEKRLSLTADSKKSAYVAWFVNKFSGVLGDDEVALLRSKLPTPKRANQ